MKIRSAGSLHRINIWNQAWQALALHRLRSLLSALGIVFAVLAVVTMLAIAEGAKTETLEQISRLGINNIIIRHVALSELQVEQARDNMVQGLFFRDVVLLRQLPGIESIAVIAEVRATVAELRDAETVSILAVNPEYMQAMGLRMAWGRFIGDVDVKNAHQVCVVGAELGKRLGNPETVEARVHLDRTPCRIVGVLQNRTIESAGAMPVADRDLGNAVLIPLVPAQLSIGGMNRQGELHEIIITAKDSALVDPISRTVRNALRWNRDGVENFEIIVPKELLHQASQTQRLFNIVLGGIAGISLLVGGIGIMNIMLANVSERTMEIGIRRAIGANQRHIIVQFLSESTLLTIIGGIIGVLAGVAAAFAVDFFIQWRTSISPWSIVLAAFMSVGVGIISGLYPAIKAARMDPVVALRAG